MTYPAVAARAGVSRTFLYDNPAARNLVTAAITRAEGHRQHEVAESDAQAEASWQQRALNAEQALKAAHAEIRTQRARIGELLGQLRDAQREHDSDTISRLSAENAALKQRIRDLTASNRTLEERLQAARSNNRFLDKRSPISKRRCWPPSREPDESQPSPRRPPDMPGTAILTHPGDQGPEYGAPRDPPAWIAFASG